MTGRAAAVDATPPAATPPAATPPEAAPHATLKDASRKATPPTVRAVAVHWDAATLHEKVRALEAAGAAVVHAEAQDGRRAQEAVRAHAPELVAIWLQWRPAHGRVLAAALGSAAATRGATVLFVDADPDPAPPALVAALRGAVPHAIVDRPDRLAFWVERIGHARRRHGGPEAVDVAVGVAVGVAPSPRPRHAQDRPPSCAP